MVFLIATCFGLTYSLWLDFCLSSALWYKRCLRRGKDEVAVSALPGQSCQHRCSCWRGEDTRSSCSLGAAQPSTSIVIFNSVPSLPVSGALCEQAVARGNTLDDFLMLVILGLKARYGVKALAFLSASSSSLTRVGAGVNAAMCAPLCAARGSERHLVWLERSVCFTQGISTFICGNNLV